MSETPQPGSEPPKDELEPVPVQSDSTADTPPDPDKPMASRGRTGLLDPDLWPPL